MLRERLAKADLPDEVRTEAERELKRLEKLPAAGARLSRHSHLSGLSFSSCRGESRLKTSSI